MFGHLNVLHRPWLSISVLPQNPQYGGPTGFASIVSFPRDSYYFEFLGISAFGFKTPSIDLMISFADFGGWHVLHQ